MIDGKIHFLTKNEVKEAQELISGHPDIFSETDVRKYKETIHEFGDIPNKYDAKLTVLALKSVHKICAIIIYRRDDYSHNAYKIEWLIVKKGGENRGYGTLLIAEACKRMRENGGRHAYLETSNARHNEKTKHFYQKIGFKRVGLIPDYFDHPMSKYRKLEDALLFHKML